MFPEVFRDHTGRRFSALQSLIGEGHPARSRQLVLLEASRIRRQTVALTEFA
jgi:hypothetical protein